MKKKTTIGNSRVNVNGFSHPQSSQLSAHMNWKILPAVFFISLNESLIVDGSMYFSLPMKHYKTGHIEQDSTFPLFRFLT